MHHHNHWDNFEIFYWMFKLSILLWLFWFELFSHSHFPLISSPYLPKCLSFRVGRAGIISEYSNHSFVHCDQERFVIPWMIRTIVGIKSIDGCTTSACAHLFMYVCECWVWTGWLCSPFAIYIHYMMFYQSLWYVTMLAWVVFNQINRCTWFSLAFFNHFQHLHRN